MVDQKICSNCQHRKKVQIPYHLECIIYDELVNELDCCGLWKEVE